MLYLYWIRSHGPVPFEGTGPCLSYNPAMPPDLRLQIEAELSAARAARQTGNEGRARVCARRAAGLAAREFLTRCGVRPRSTYAALQELAVLPGLAPGLLAAADRLTLRVSQAFSLPADVDLIAEASRLIEGLEHSS